MKTTANESLNSAGSMEHETIRPRSVTIVIRRLLQRAAEVAAMLGGGTLVLAAALTVYSVLARNLFNAPFVGDFEIIELACVLVVSLFLPYCQLVQGHAAVDIFVSMLPRRASHALSTFAFLAAACFYSFVAWRSYRGMFALIANSDQTMVLGIPRYVVFPPLIASFILCASIALLQATSHRREAGS